MGCSGAQWLPSHHPGRCCTLVVIEEDPPPPPPLLCKALWVPRKSLYKCNKLLLIIIIINYERMEEFFHVSLHLKSRSRKVLGEAVSLPRFGTLSTVFLFCFVSRAKVCTTFTLHDLTDFYVEMVTVHRIKINDHSCFHNRCPLKNETKIKTSLRGVSGALRSVHILWIGRIGSVSEDNMTS